MTSSMQGEAYTGGSTGGYAQQSEREEPRWQGEERRGRRWEPSAGDRSERLARGLGWFSLGLGLTQVAAPRGVARLIGLRGSDDDRKAMIAIGVREIASGIGILSQDRPTPGVWSRVGGDVMDLALLGRALNSHRNDRNRVAMATVAVAGVTMLDVMAGRRLSTGENGVEGAEMPQPKEPGVQVRQQITVRRSPQEIYAFWRNFENLHRFMAHLDSVRVIDDRRSHWTARAPAGRTVEWDAEIVEDRPGELIAWRALPESDVPNEGTVRFVPAPGDQGTEIHVELRYEPPGGKLGALAAKLFGEEPNQQVKGDLRRFKQVIEAGEVVHSDSSIHRGPHPAQPPAEVPPGLMSQTMEGAAR
jgi:uncharacterized membrane protein